MINKDELVDLEVAAKMAINGVSSTSAVMTGVFMEKHTPRLLAEIRRLNEEIDILRAYADFHVSTEELADMEEKKRQKVISAMIRVTMSRK